MSIDDVYGLERHRYAPEMNKLHMNDGTVYSVPQQTSIAHAIAYLKYRLK